MWTRQPSTDGNRDPGCHPSFSRKQYRNSDIFSELEDWDIVKRILTQEFELRKINVRWIPHKLTTDHKIARQLLKFRDRYSEQNLCDLFTGGKHWPPQIIQEAQCRPALTLNGRRARDALFLRHSSCPRYASHAQEPWMSSHFRRGKDSLVTSSFTKLWTASLRCGRRRGRRSKWEGHFWIWTIHVRPWHRKHLSRTASPDYLFRHMSRICRRLVSGYLITPRPRWRDCSSRPWTKQEIG
jgi:hypothetical protein